MHDVLQDLRHAVRRLVANPGFAMVTILAIALGVGANTAIFTVVDAVLLRPLPYPDADRLVWISAHERPDLDAAMAGADYLDLRAQLRSMSGVAASRGMGMNLARDPAERVDTLVAARDFFTVLGARPLLGRAFDPEQGGPRQAVLSEPFWRARFGASPGAVGSTLQLDGEPVTVVGVMPAEVLHPSGPQLWVTPRGRVPDHPLRPRNDTAENRTSQYLDVLGRLRPGVSLSAAQAEASALAARLEREHPENRDRGFHLVPLRERLFGNVRPTLLVLWGAVAFILLIACANVANLLLARAVARQQEVAIRSALGATRGRLLRLFFADGLVLAAGGTMLGVLSSLWAGPLLAALAPGLVRPEALRVDLRVLSFTLLLTVGTAVAFGLVPALSATAEGAALRGSSRQSTGGRTRSRLRSALVIAEVALALVLLIGAGLMVRSFERLQSVHPGFDPARVMAADTALSPLRYPDDPAQIAFFVEVVRRMKAAPGVESAGVINRLPLSGGNSSRDVQLVSDPSRPLHSDVRIATGGYFATVRIPLRSGRTFTDVEAVGGARVAMINETFAQRAFPGQSPLGERLVATRDQKPLEIVGVVGDVKHLSLDAGPRPELYLPLAVEPWPLMTFVARGRGDLAGLLRAEVSAVDPAQALAKVNWVEERLASSLAARRFGASLIALLAGIAFVLALTGLYGVMAYSVAQRTREMGIRLALGATPRAVLQLVLAQALRLVGSGVALGILGALALSQLLRTLLFGVTASDPATYVALPLLLCSTAAAATLVAARRATVVDPVVALRAE